MSDFCKSGLLCIFESKHQPNNAMRKELTELSDQELVQEARKAKTAAVINAVLIGFLFGIVFYSIMKNSWGFLTLIPLFLAYKLINNSNYKKKELEDLLRERKLK